jgi:LysR family hydrogen peroxide-inducible transcriptional activator
LLDLNDLEETARRSVGELVGTISLGVSPTLGPYLLPGIVGILKQEMPDLRLHIREGIPNDQMFELRSGALDMVLTLWRWAGRICTLSLCSMKSSICGAA